jgi:hypothetical protein
MGRIQVMVRWESDRDVRYAQQQWLELTRLRISLTSMYITSCLESTS